jgi:hypothetical protein
MSDDEQQDPEAAMERFKAFARKVFSVSKDDPKPAEEPAEEITIEETEIVEDAD